MFHFNKILKLCVIQLAQNGPNLGPDEPNVDPNWVLTGVIGPTKNTQIGFKIHKIV